MRSASEDARVAVIPYEKMQEFALDEARFDQPAPAERDDSRAYAICSTPRSGSWLVCRQLVNAGLGVPSEYFNILHWQPLCERWGQDEHDTRAYLNALRSKRTTPNRVWGTKLLWTQYAERRNALKIELIARCRLLFLYREDVVTQAVSLHLSRLTGIWDFDGRVVTRPRTDIAWGDPADLAACEATIHDQNRHWRELFAMLRLTPTMLRYEDVVADQPGMVRTVAGVLGLEPGEYRVPPPEPRDSAFPPEIEERRRELITRWLEERKAHLAATGRAG